MVSRNTAFGAKRKKVARRYSGMRGTTILVAAALSVGVLSSTQVAADDTEIFFAPKLSDAERAANVMFMFDTSGSMLATDRNGISRLSRLKDAMTNVVSTSDNINIAIGAFNGVFRGGSILMPATDVNADLCPNANCDSIEIRGEIKADADDGIQRTDNGQVDLYGNNLDIYTTSQRSTSTYPCGWYGRYTCTRTTTIDVPNVLALRFSDLNIPRGATINHASLQFLADRTQTGDTQFTIVAEASDNSPVLTEVNQNLSDRLSNVTSASATWDLEIWRNGYQQYEHLSGDLNAIVEEVTDREGWCGGNALTLLITNTGSNRNAVSHDSDPYRSPVLHIDYDPSSVDWNDTCIRSESTSHIAHGTDDVVQDVTTGVIEAGANRLRTHNGQDNEQIIGLRFKKVQIPVGSTITEAYLQLPISGSVAGGVDLAITAENTGYSAPIDSQTVSALTTDRTYLTPAINWVGVPETSSNGSGMATSPDIGTLVAPLVSNSGWTGDGAVTFKLTTEATSRGQRFIDAFESPSGSGARLLVKYQISGSAMGGEAPVLWTGRDEMVRTMMNLEAYGSTPLVDAYFEASQYMRGDTVEFGKQRGSQDNGSGGYPDYPFRLSAPSTYNTGDGVTVSTPAGCTAPNYSSPACRLEEITGSPTYINPTFGQCQSNQIVLLSDGIATAYNSKALIQATTGGTCLERGSETCGIELAKWLFDNDHDSAPGMQKLITHTIGVDTTNSLLETMAEQGGGSFNEVSTSSELTNVFKNIIQSAILNTTSFVAPSSTSSLSNRLVNSNELYFAMFEPSKTTNWDGNLKRFQLASNSVTGELEIRDATSTLAIGDDGAVLDTSQSYWSAQSDGNKVSNGGAASNIVLQNRKVLTSLASDTSTTDVLTALVENDNDIDDDLLEIQGKGNAYRMQLIKWARGVDVLDSDEDNSTSDARTQMGDPMHSTPFVLNYEGDEISSAVEAVEATDTQAAVEAQDATYEDPTSVLFIGTNHGFLHAFDTSDGTEKFAFIPRELLSNLDYFFLDAAANHDERPYGLDGEVTGWHDDKNGDGLVNGEDRAFIYVGMRRGGRNYYALDVTDPANPSFAWKIEGGKTGDFLELGQTWSKPIKAKVNYDGVARDVLFFGGGYDDINDDESVRAEDLSGRAIFMVDAATGAHLGSINSSTVGYEKMTYSMPSELRVINPDGDEYADMIFVGDTGGQLWRFDINNFPEDGQAFITGAVVAQISGDDAGNNRRFFYEPDVALIKGKEGGMFLNIAIGSGARPNPNTDTSYDGFYTFRDPHIFGPPTDEDGNVSYPAMLTESDLVDISANFATSDAMVVADANDSDDASGEESAGDAGTGDADSGEGGSAESTADAGTGSIDNGWFFRFQASGEKSLSSALTVDNELMFTTYLPPDYGTDVCSAALGSGRLYTLDVFNGDPANSQGEDSEGYVELEIPGIPPRVAGMIVEAAPNEVSIIVGTESLGSGGSSEEFERTFWAEH